MQHLVSFRLVIFGPVVQLFLYTITEQTGWGKGREERVSLPRLLIAVVAVGHLVRGPNIFLGGSFHIGPSRRFSERKFARTWLYSFWEVVRLQVAKACSAPAKYRRGAYFVCDTDIHIAISRDF